MSLHEVGFLVFIVSAFSLFGGVLGWASWEETRLARRKQKEQAAQSHADTSD